jgi:hypothetical protein
MHIYVIIIRYNWLCDRLHEHLNSDYLFSIRNLWGVLVTSSKTSCSDNRAQEGSLPRLKITTHICIHIYTFMYIYTLLYVYVYIYVNRLINK